MTHMNPDVIVRVRRISVSVSKGSLKSKPRTMDGAEEEENRLAPSASATDEGNSWLTRRQLRRPQRAATIDAPPDATRDNELLRAFRSRGKTIDESV